jgi:hypothetical protein
MGIDADDKHPCAIRRRSNTFRLSHQGRPCGYRDTREPSGGRGIDRRRSNRRQIDAVILPDFGRFDQDTNTNRGMDAAIAAQLSHTRDGLIGPFRTFDRQDVTISHDHCLADIKRARCLEQGKSNRDIVAVSVTGPIAAE